MQKQSFTFDAPRPSYAFPATYPPQTRPAATLSISFPAVPLIPPAGLRPSRTGEDADINALVSTFARLTISDQSSHMTTRQVQTARPTLPVLSPTNKRRRTSLLRTSPNVVPPAPRPAVPMLTVPAPTVDHSSSPTMQCCKNQAGVTSPCKKKATLPRRRPSTRPKRSSPIDCPFISKSRTPSLISDSGSEPSSPEQQPSPAELLGSFDYPAVLETETHSTHPLDIATDFDFSHFWTPAYRKPPYRRAPLTSGARIINPDPAVYRSITSIS